MIMSNGNPPKTTINTDIIVVIFPYQVRGPLRIERFLGLDRRIIYFKKRKIKNRAEMNSM